MIPEEMLEFIEKKSILRPYKYEWEQQDPYSQVLLSRDLFSSYNVDFHRSLTNETLRIYEFDRECDNPHIIHGKITTTACVFVSGGQLTFKILQYADHNESHLFDDIDELCDILEYYNLLE